MREFQLLRRIRARNADLCERVLVPPGDDMALVRLGQGGAILVGVDQVVAGRHFDPRSTPLDLVGRKSVTRSLSDIAAMAGRPLVSVVAAVLPREFSEARAMELFEGMWTAANGFDCPIVGGDVSFHEREDLPLVCSVTALAEPTTAQPVTRAGARAGDAVYVTGRIGGSLRSGRHLTFEPRIAQAIALAALLGERLHAMIDISDGLGRDAGHIAEESNVRIEIEARRVPLSDGVMWQEALGEGEDYELCFTAAGDVPAEIEGLPITPIGGVVPAAAGITTAERVLVRDGARTHAAGELGWEHGGG